MSFRCILGHYVITGRGFDLVVAWTPERHYWYSHGVKEQVPRGIILNNTFMVIILRMICEYLLKNNKKPFGYPNRYNLITVGWQVIST